MAKAQTVSAAYLLGLSDERALLRDMVQRGEYVPAVDAPAMLATAKATRARGWSGDMAEYMRASVDFWAGQCAKLERAGA